MKGLPKLQTSLLPSLATLEGVEEALRLTSSRHLRLTSSRHLSCLNRGNREVWCTVRVPYLQNPSLRPIHSAEVGAERAVIRRKLIAHEDPCYTRPKKVDNLNGDHISSSYLTVLLHRMVTLSTHCREKGTGRYSKYPSPKWP